MPSYMKQFIIRKLKENVPLSEIKKDLREKGYDAEAINKAVREAIGGMDKKLSVHTIQIIVLLIGIVVAIGVGIYLTSGYRTSEESTPTSVQNQTELGLIEKRKSEVGQPSILLQGTPEEIECSKYIPFSLLNLPLQNYSTKYSIDGSNVNSLWRSSSSTSEKYSLKESPSLYFVHVNNEFQGCGFSQKLDSKKYNAIKLEMKTNQCARRGEYFTSTKSDEFKILSILTADYNLYTIVYNKNINLDVNAMVCL